MGDFALAILGRAPVPGAAKTRLIPRLGPEGAAALHALLLRRTVRTALAAGFGSTTLWCAPDRGHPGFRGLAAAGPLHLRDQPEGDLGVRMATALQAHLAGGAPALLIGTDCPGLTPLHLREARAAIEGGADAVFLPAEDGGYALIGLARHDASLFEGIPWGTSGVMAATRERLRALGWTAPELPALRDVDRPEDVDWLVTSGILDHDEQPLLDRLARPER